MTDEPLLGLLENHESSYFGKYKAFVADNADPEKRGRLRLRIPSVLGNSVLSGWALPCAPYGGSAGQGFFFIPEKDAGVWVEFEAGLIDYPVWVGTFWGKPGGTTQAPDPGGTQSPPTSKIIKTLNHTIELADATGGEAITITDAKNSNKVTLDQNGVTIEDQNGNKITLAASGVTIASKKVLIGSASASEFMVLGTTLQTLITSFSTQLLAHTHVGNLGAPTSPPVGLQPLDISSALSKKHSVE